MMTRQSTGYFQQVPVILLLCFISSFACVGSALALTGNNIDQCYDCHGSPNDIRPVDSTYRNITTGAFVGNHRTHLSTVTTVSNVCATCHGPAPTVMDHRDGRIHLNNGSIKNGSYAKGPFFNQTSRPVLGSCSSVNCHFNTATPTWGTNPPWAATKTANDGNVNCAACHSATTLASGTHTKHITAGGNTQAACKSCHPDYNALAGTNAFQHATSAARPINVNFSAAPNLGGAYAGGRTATADFLPPTAVAATGTCSALYCHSPGTKAIAPFAGGNQTATWGGSLTCKGCHKSDAASLDNMATGSHARHVNGVGGIIIVSCVRCHAATVNAGMAIKDVAKHVNATVDIVFDSTSTAVGGKYKGAVAPTGVAPGTLPYGQCENVYCHSNGQNNGGTGITYKSPTWGVSSTGNCGTCHDVNNIMHAGGSASQISTGSHTKHLSYNSIATSDLYRCAQCHNLSNEAYPIDPKFGVSAGGGCTSACHSVKHVNHQIEVMIPTELGATPHYDGSSNPGSGYSTCSNVYCHGDGQTPPGYAPTALWGSGPISCTACHGSATVNSPAGTALSGKHAAHVNPAVNTELGTDNGFGCIECHQLTIANNTTLNAATGTTVHVNKFIEYTGLRAGGPLRYNSVTKQCSNFYCHSNAKAGTTVAEFKNPPVWSSASTLGCNGCHGNNTVLPDAANPTNANLGQPNYTNGGAGLASANSHKKHVIDAGLTNTTGCYNCHAKTVDKYVASRFRPYSTTHVSGSINIVFSPAIGGTYLAGVGNKTCTATACHAAGTPKWGDVSLACNSCHSANNSGYWAANSSHRQHWEDAAVLPTSFTAAPGNTGTATTYMFQCSSCHASPAAHSNLTNSASTFGSAEVFFGYTTANRKGSYTYAGSTIGTEGTIKWTAGNNCSTTYCHSDGNGGAPRTTTFTWNSPNKTLRCDGCHGSDASKPATIINTGLHRNHIDPSLNVSLGTGNLMKCAQCHAKTVGFANNTTITDKTRHINKFKDYSGQFARGSASYNSGTKSCSNLYCHSNAKAGTAVAEFKNPPVWSSATTLGCNGCHGNNTVLPDGANPTNVNLGQPNYINGGAGVASANSHKKHVIEAGMSNSTGCYNCHAKTVDKFVASRFRPYSTTHVSGSINIVFSPAIGGTYLAGVGNKTCTATACHGAGTPKWGDVSLACNSCHSANNSGYWAANSSHRQHWEDAAVLPTSFTAAPGNTGTATTYMFQCSSCHASPAAHSNLTNAASSFGSAEVFFGYTSANRKGTYTYAGSTLSSEGTIKWTAGNNCSTTYCHSDGNGGNPVVTAFTWNSANGTLGCNACHGDATTVGRLLTSAKHQQHINNASLAGNYGCIECHAKTVSSDSVVSDKTRHINKLKDYSGAKAYKSGYTVGSAGSCTTYCHSSGKKGLAIASVVVEPVNPNWSAAAPALDCKGCHGASTGTGTFVSSAGEPNYPNQGKNVAGSNSHQKHVGTTGAATTCINCHNSTVTAAGALKAGNTHTDKTINVVQGNGKTLTWAAGTKTCSNISCHFNSSAQWGDAALTCNGCHGGPAALGSNIIASNKHTAHVNNSALGTNYTCGECHAKTVTVGNDTAISNAANHANGFTDYSGADAYKSGYTVGSLGTCTTSCHSSGKKGLTIGGVLIEPANPSWNAVPQPLDCKGCHGTSTGGASFTSSAGEPNYPNQGTNVAGSNSHQRHVGTSGAATTCINCHNSTVDAAGALKAANTHTNKTIDVIQGNGKTFSWASGTKTCSSFASGCHYSGTPQWGATLTCGDCHGALSAIHAKHTLIAGATYGSVANNSTVSGYNFGCGNCHPTNTSFHADGIVEITLNKNDGGTLKSLNNVSDDTSGYTRTAGSSVVCSASYCHSNGGKTGGALSTTTFYASPDWFGTFSGDKCSMCHGNSPNAGGKVGSDAHYNKNLLGYANMSGGHVIGIHSENIYNGTNGIAPEANSITGSHGRASTSSTINCNICHYSTVTTYANDKNAACQKCHYSGGTGGVKNPADLIADKRFHVNGTVDVAFYPSLSVASKAQLRDYSYDTATWTRKNGYKFTSTSSHDNAVTALNTATMWNSATKGCTNIACHNGKSVTWTATNGVTTCYSCHTSLWNAK